MVYRNMGNGRQGFILSEFNLAKIASLENHLKLLGSIDVLSKCLQKV